MEMACTSCIGVKLQPGRHTPFGREAASVDRWSTEKRLARTTHEARAPCCQRRPKALAAQALRLHSSLAAFPALKADRPKSKCLCARGPC